jgi:hypothetical protein
MQPKKVLFAIIIGLILFLTDMRFGWMSFVLGGVWTLFVIVLIVGILAGDISGGFVAAFLTELIGVVILALIPEVFFPFITITATDFLVRMWLVMSLSISYHTRFPDEPIPWIEELVIIVLLILLSPLVYAMSLLFALIGGLIGRLIHPRVFKPKGAPVRVPAQQPQPSVQPPPQPEPEEEPSTSDFEPSESE